MSGTQVVQSIEEVSTREVAISRGDLLLACVTHLMSHYREIGPCPRSLEIGDDLSAAGNKIKAAQKESAHLFAKEDAEGLWRFAHHFYAHALPNAIDAVYDAIDRNICPKHNGRIEVKISLRADPEVQLVIEVSDNGSGINVDTLKMLEQNKCSSTKESRGHFIGGRGVGIAVHLTEYLNGDGSSITFDTNSDAKALLLVLCGRRGQRQAQISHGTRTGHGTTVTAVLPLHESYFEKLYIPLQKHRSNSFDDL